ncbi:GlsB/YeaQ/YmgE family stress response membrane protein [Candidatus Saccharibacteria bacterium]|nr:GlsB/YeaQ/YmgE family stress response membrane protein [Candidatus Saccharibacteria bacterium]
MDFIIWILVGALAGWIASMIMKTDAQMGALANILVGILGAFIGGFVLNNILKIGVTAGELSIPGVLASIFGAVILLAILKAVRR